MAPGTTNEIERIAASVSRINEYIRTLARRHLATKNANLAFMGMAIEALKWADTNFWYEFAITGHSVIVKFRTAVSTPSSRSTYGSKKAPDARAAS